jgi:hypothetical protein
MLTPQLFPTSQPFVGSRRYLPVPRRLLASAAALVSLVAASVLTAAPSAVAGPPAGMGACPIFPADSFWHADVRGLAVHERSSAWLAAMGGPDRRLHPEFGPSGEAQPYGIPYAIVDGSHAQVNVGFDYADESDPGPYPFGPDVPVEGGSDRHALMLDRDRCVLSELYAAQWNGGQPTAGSGAVFDLRSNALRPATWTSADAAGLAIFPGLLRLDEVRAGRVDHVVRVTAQRTDRAYIWPARHQAGAARDANLPPMGAWFRLRPDYQPAGLLPDTQVIIEAFKTHGMIVADNGSNWFFTGSADDGWDTRVLDQLKAIPAGAFEAVDTSPMMVNANSGQVRSASAGTPAPPGGGAPAATTTARPTPARTSRPAQTTTAVPAPVITAGTVPPDTTTTTDRLVDVPRDPSASEALNRAWREAALARQREALAAAEPKSRTNLWPVGLAALLCALGCCGVLVLIRRIRRDPNAP